MMENIIMIKRILNFDIQDWKHIRYLSLNFFIQLTRGNLIEVKDALYWIKLHISYDSNKVEKGD